MRKIFEIFELLAPILPHLYVTVIQYDYDYHSDKGYIALYNWFICRHETHEKMIGILLSKQFWDDATTYWAVNSTDKDAFWPTEIVFPISDLGFWLRTKGQLFVTTSLSALCWLVARIKLFIWIFSRAFRWFHVSLSLLVCPHRMVHAIQLQQLFMAETMYKCNCLNLMISF